MRTKALTLIFLSILLSSCFNKEIENENQTQTWTNIEINNKEKIENKNTESWAIENESGSIDNNSDIKANTWETNSWMIEEKSKNIDKAKLEEITKEANITESWAKDKSIDELLKDFDEDLNIEEILSDI